jgi:hypothetical protein
VAKKASGNARRFPFPSERAYAQKATELLSRFKWFTLFDGSHADATGEFIFCDLWKCVKQQGQWQCFQRSWEDMQWHPVPFCTMPRFNLWPIHRATSKSIMWSMINTLTDKVFHHVSSSFKEADWDPQNTWRGNLAKKVIRKRLVNTIVKQGGGEIACKKMTQCLWAAMLDKEKSGWLIAIHGNQAGFTLHDILDLCQNEAVARQWKEQIPHAMPLLSRMPPEWVHPSHATYWLMKSHAIYPRIKTVRLAREILASPYSMLSAVAATGSVKYWFLSPDIRHQLDQLRVRDRANVVYRIAHLAVHKEEFALLDRIIDFYCKTQYLLPTLPNRAGFRVYIHRFTPVIDSWSCLASILRKSKDKKATVLNLVADDAWLKSMSALAHPWAGIIEPYRADIQAQQLRGRCEDLGVLSKPTPPASPRRF